MMGEKQASMMHAMREMMAEIMRNKGRSESGSAEGSAAVGAVSYTHLTLPTNREV